MEITIITTNATGPITLSGGGDTLVVDPGASLFRQGTLTSADLTLSSADSTNRVHVLGSIYGASAIRLGDDAFIDTNNDVVIAAGGFVGAYAQDGVAVEALGDSSEIINGGTIYSERGSACVFGPGLFSATLTNDGLIESRGSAATIRRATGTDDINVVVNNGTIRGASALSTAYDGLIAVNGTDFFNNRGTVIGRITLGDGEDDLVNSGAIEGVIDLGNGDDSVINTGVIKRSVLLGDGVDRYDGSSGRVISVSPSDEIQTGTVDGGGGDDTLIGGASGETFIGGTGADIMEGRGGNDAYEVDNPGDKVIETAGGGIDIIGSSLTITLIATVENVTLTANTAINATGNALANAIQGRLGANILSGLAGNDQIFAFNGNDRLIGGLGADRLSGMLDADRFVFNSVTESRTAGGVDRIMDFSRAQGDKIQLNVIDANTTKAGNQAFTFIAAAAFSGTAGELRFQKIGTDTHIQADVNGDGKIDMTVISDVVTSFIKTDFIL